MGVGSARWGTTAGGLGVAAILAAVTFVLPWVNRQVQVRRQLPADTPVAIGAGTVVTPQPGALLDVGRSLPGRAGGTIVLVVPGAGLEYQLRAGTYGGSLDAAARHTAQQLRRRDMRVTGGQSFETVEGAAGRQGGFQPATGGGAAAGGAGAGAGAASTAGGGSGRNGSYAVVIVAGRVLVEAFALGTADALRREAAAVDATFRSIAAGGRS